MIPTNPPEYDYKNSVVVPLAFLDKLLRCYYGTGPRDGDPIMKFSPENPSSEIIPEISNLKGITIDSNVPPGYKPKGFAADKLKAKQSGIRYTETTEE
jgi:hypothetical protein|tara:strand:+ start:4496 stop:4789 length:294 start_codon:yes stop_codon:yes gene_type:complete